MLGVKQLGRHTKPCVFGPECKSVGGLSNLADTLSPVCLVQNVRVLGVKQLGRHTKPCVFGLECKSVGG